MINYGCKDNKKDLDIKEKYSKIDVITSYLIIKDWLTDI